MISQLKASLWSIPIALSFFIGGLLQYLAIITPTQTNVLCIASLILVLFKAKKLNTVPKELLPALLLLHTLIVFATTNSNLSSLFVYIYYITCLTVSIVAGRAYASIFFKRHGKKLLIKATTIFLFIQAIVTTGQNLFTDTFLALSRAEIGYIDAVFGTLYLQSDASLAAICTVILIMTHAIRPPIATVLVISTLAIISVFNGNSSAMKLAFSLVMLVLLADRFISFTSNRRLTIYLASFSLALLILTTLSESFSQLYSYSLNVIYDEFTNRNSYSTAGRFAPIGHILFEKLSFVGSGLLTYYNPITKEWLYNAGFSTLYVLYVDSGIISIAILYYYYFKLTYKSSIPFIQKSCLLFCLLAYSQFNFILTDIAFCFTIGFAVAALQILNNAPKTQAKLEPEITPNKMRPLRNHEVI